MAYGMYIMNVTICMYIYTCELTCVLILLSALGAGSFLYTTFTTKMSAQGASWTGLHCVYGYIVINVILYLNSGLFCYISEMIVETSQ